MPQDDTQSNAAPPLKPNRYFTDAARVAAAAAKAAKRADPDRFGMPELFVVKAGERAFAWELRRFGGIVLQRGPESFASAALARANGEKALSVLCASPGLPTFTRQTESRAGLIEGGERRPEPDCPT